MSTPPRLLVTGATGYVGRRVLAAARDAGVPVVAAARRPGAIPVEGDLRAVALDLTREDDLDAILADVDAVVHLAAVLDARELEAHGKQDPNLVATRRLLDAARRRGVRRFLFASSPSARAGGATRYARSKAEIETWLDRPGEVAVRLGLVTGGAPLGVWGRLLRLLRSAPLMPVIRPDAPVHPVRVDDVARALVQLASAEATPPGRVWIGSPRPMRFVDYLRLVGRERLGRSPWMMPVPGAAALLVCRLSEIVPFAPRIDAERVRGLIALERVEPGSMPDAASLGIELGDVATGLSSEGRRRRLAGEGRALAGYVLGGVPGRGVVRRYVRAVEAEPDTRPLELPRAILLRPGLLRLVEPLPGRAPRLRRRLEIATAIAEMTPQGAAVFHRYDRRSRLTAWLGLVALGAVEAPLLLLRAVFGRILSER